MSSYLEHLLPGRKAYVMEQNLSVKHRLDESKTTLYHDCSFIL